MVKAEPQAATAYEALTWQEMRELDRALRSAGRAVQATYDYDDEPRGLHAELAALHHESHRALDGKARPRGCRRVDHGAWNL